MPLNGLVHRLDRGTSGVVLAAKNQEAFEYLKQQFKERNVEKKYLALVLGVPQEKEGTIVAEIMRSNEPPKRWYSRPCEASDPRAAVTDWKVLRARGATSVLEVTPKTGRTHQIRVHLASIGHPILGDTRYGGTDAARIMLHAEGISLTLPDGERAAYQAPPPKDFNQT